MEFTPEQIAALEAHVASLSGGGNLTFGGGMTAKPATPGPIGWANMTDLQRLAHSIKNGTDYQNKVSDPGMFEAAQRYLEKDSQPAMSNSGDSLATLYAMENTKAQQQEQAAANDYGFSNAQQSAYDSLTSKGLVDADGNLVIDGLSKQQLYDLWSSGFGLGETEAHKSLRDQAHAAFSAISSPGGTIELPGSGGGLTFGGGSVVTDAEQAAPKPEAQCGPGQIQVRGVCVDWDGPSGAGDNGGGQANPNRRGPSTTGTGYLGAGAGPANTGIGQAGQNQATPWADAYFRAKERAAAQGPVSRLFANELEGR
jgi:hypothetical protein